MWLVFTIITILIWGLAEIFYKKGNSAKEKYSHLKTVIFVGFIMGIHAIFVLLFKDINFDPKNILIYLPVSLCYMISMTCSYFGVKYIQESISDPIENTSGAIVPVLCAVFLHETIQSWSIVAIVVIVIGIIGVGILENRGSTDRKKVLGKKLAVFAFAMPFCYALLDALGTFLDIFYIDDWTDTLLVNVTEDTIENVANTCYELTFLFLAIVFLVFIAIKKVKLFSNGEEVDKKLNTLNTYKDRTIDYNENNSVSKVSCENTESNLELEITKNHGFIKTVLNQKYKIMAAVCETIGQFTYVFALAGNGKIASPMIGGGCVVVSLLLSRVFLKEKLTKLQYLFICIVLIGIIILAIVEE